MKSRFGVFVFALLISWIKSEAINLSVDDQTECQQLRNRVETLEAAVRTIVSALTIQKDHQFTPINTILQRDPALLAILLNSPTPVDSIQNKSQLLNGNSLHSTSIF